MIVPARAVLSRVRRRTESIRSTLLERQPGCLVLLRRVVSAVTELRLSRFALEYQETDAKHHYRAKRDLSADEILRALVAYSSGADDWKATAEWELVKW